MSKATTRTCPKCGSDDSTFRSRKTIEAEDGKGDVVETKYKCKACNHEWKVRAPAKEDW